MILKNAAAWTRSRRLLLIGGACIAVAALSNADLAIASPPADETQVESVLRSYKDAIERLDASDTETLFAPDAQIFESGGSEGTYRQYLSHHLGPELVEFASFKFDNYAVAVRFEGALAMATETYTYRIVLKTGGEPIERIGVATSVLKKSDGRWRIIQLHSSSRKPKTVEPQPPK